MTQSPLARPSRGPRDYARTVFQGYCMGAADVVPGVSGGTIAFIFGIYEELLDSIKAIDLETIRLALRFRFRALLERLPWAFLISLFAGIMLAILTLSRGLEWLLENEREKLFGFFFGLVLASILTIGRKIRWNPVALVNGLLSTVVAFLIVGMVPTRTPDELWFYFVSGAIAICAMILPGISGSFILLLMGKYQDLVAAVNDAMGLDPAAFLKLGVFMVGALVGITTFARVVSWLFARYHDATVALLTGLMLGSLRKIWPWKETAETMIDRHGKEVPIRELNLMPGADTPGFWMVLGLMALGFVAVLLIDRMAPPEAEVVRGVE